MYLVNDVFELAEKFMNNSRYVVINTKQINLLTNALKDEQSPTFPKLPTKDDIYKTCILEFVGSSLNYCYWYGKPDIRPNDSSSGKLMELIIHSFEHFERTGGRYCFETCLDRLIKNISLSRFPMIEERIKHINELRNYGQKFIDDLTSKRFSFDYYLDELIRNFPGFASDLFLKRAFLFFAQLNRNLGWFEEEVSQLPIPADYQVPKMLEAENIINYDRELEYLIENNILIPKGSLYECEIRAASIIACEQLRVKLGWTMPQIDGYFWLRRKDVTKSFHLTVTTDY